MRYFLYLARRLNQPVLVGRVLKPVEVLVDAKLPQSCLVAFKMHCELLVCRKPYMNDGITIKIYDFRAARLCHTDFRAVRL